MDVLFRFFVTLMMAGSLASAAYAEEASAERGKVNFEAICAHCHTTTYDESSVGAPGLKDVIERHDPEWLDHWLKSPEAFARVDETAKALSGSNKYGLVMPTLPEMQDDQKRADVIEYLKTL